jgi:hypothetical protein
MRFTMVTVVLALVHAQALQAGPRVEFSGGVASPALDEFRRTIDNSDSKDGTFYSFSVGFPMSEDERSDFHVGYEHSWTGFDFDGKRMDVRADAIFFGISTAILPRANSPLNLVGRAGYSSMSYGEYDGHTFWLEPMVQLSAEIDPYVRLGMFAGYRFAESRQMENSNFQKTDYGYDLSGRQLGAFLRVGL